MSSATRFNGPIRFRLFRDMALVVVAMAGILVAANAILIGEFRQEFAWSQISKAAALVREEVLQLVGPVEQQLLIARDWLRASQLGPADQERLTTHFVPILTHLEQIAGLLDVGRETIKSRMRYALKRLRQQLEDCL